MHRILLPLILAALLGGQADGALTDGLVVQMNLADNAASTTVVAQVGTNGTLEGGDNTSAKSVAGPNAAIASAFSLNGTDDAVDISGNSLSFASGAAFSVACWVEWDLSTGYVCGISGGTASRIIKISDTQIRLGSIFDVASLGTTNWCLVVVTRTAANSENVYVNAVVSTTGAQTDSATFAPTKIGQSSTAFGDQSVASFSVWNRALSQSEITQLYNSGNGRAYPWSTAKPTIWYYLHATPKPRGMFAMLRTLQTPYALAP